MAVRTRPQDEFWPTRVGDSVGHWEGDTLVVDTVAIKPDILPLVSCPMRMSDQLHFVERMRLVSHDEIQDEFTMEDPVALAKPLKVTFSYRARDGHQSHGRRNRVRLDHRPQPRRQRPVYVRDDPLASPRSGRDRA